MEKKLFAESMLYLQSMYGHQVADNVLKMYWNRFSMWDYEKWTKSVEVIIDEFVPTARAPFPLFRHFLEAIGDDSKSKSRNVIGYIVDAVSRVGAYRSVDFGDSKLHAVILQYGGWPTICSWSNDDWKMKETAFIANYEAASDTRGPNHLAGLTERDNTLGGYTDYLPDIQAAGSIAGSPNRQIDAKNKTMSTLIDNLCEKKSIMVKKTVRDFKLTGD